MVVDLVPVYLGDGRELVRRVVARLRAEFDADVRTRAPWFDPEVCYDRSRGQYHSTLLLGLLLDDPGAPADRVLAVTGVDLYIPVLTYVFGEAQLGGRAAAVSIHRLRAEAYGLPADPQLLAARLETEAVHELGHTFGLVHCREPSCAMHSSTYVEEIDLKGPGFCGACRQRVARASAGPEQGRRTSARLLP